MNMNPDEATLARWLDDELTGSELAIVEAWAADQPGQIAARSEIRQWRATIAAAIPAAVEPPYPDFFNSRILQAIQADVSQATLSKKKPFPWGSWFMPLAACTGMALAFVIGKKSQTPPSYDVTNAPRAIPVEPMVYTPESGVNAEWFASSEATATVIVLSGVAAIPDTTDFSRTASVPSPREIDSTAVIQTEPTNETGP
jgi:hypothetical protein